MAEQRLEEWPGEPRHCDQCGTALDRAHLYGRERGVCQACGKIAFRSPSIGVAVLVRDGDGRVLLILRGPGSTRPGTWAIPAGYLDYGEDVREGAARELFEETGLIAEVGEPVFVASNWHDPAKLTVGVWFEGRVVGGHPIAGDDAVDIGWFELDRLPELAFETDRALLDSLRG
jgi:ADP-ribose pyrophosphatase YjhB (NUDIX family)